MSRSRASAALALAAAATLACACTCAAPGPAESPRGAVVVESPREAPAAWATAAVTPPYPPPPEPAASAAGTDAAVPGAERELLEAYERYWELYARALLALDGSRLPEVMTGPRLQRAREEIARLELSGHAVRVDVESAPIVGMLRGRRPSSSTATATRATWSTRRAGAPSPPGASRTSSTPPSRSSARRGRGRCASRAASVSREGAPRARVPGARRLDALARPRGGRRGAGRGLRPRRGRPRDDDPGRGRLRAGRRHDLHRERAGHPRFAREARGPAGRGRRRAAGLPGDPGQHRPHQHRVGAAGPRRQPGHLSVGGQLRRRELRDRLGADRRWFSRRRLRRAAAPAHRSPRGARRRLPDRAPAPDRGRGQPGRRARRA